MFISDARDSGAIAYHRSVFKFFGSSSSPSESPVPNSYWVEPGRLLAGEYPGSRADSQSRIQALLDAGFTSFIDLTGEGELPSYVHEFGDRDVRHRRFAIVDHGIPDSSVLMAEVVAAIAADLEAGRRVYVHCRAGIGRTGMAVGCYLVHQGLDGPAALEKLQTLWQRCARARSWPSVPETEDQIRFVRTWVASGSQASVGAQRIEGSLLGLAVGEGLALAMGERALTDATWMVESKRIETLPSGADTAMTIAVAESLLERGEADSDDQLQRYFAWTQQPDMQGRVPAELKRVLAVWKWSRKSSPGSHDPKNLDAHTLARSLAAALFAQDKTDRAAELAAEVSRPTLQSPLVLDACRIWAATLAAALQGAAKPELLALRAAREALQARQLKPQIAALLEGDWRPTEPREGALAVLASALEIFRFTNSLDIALREAVRVGSTCAALVGSLAGAYYGSTGLPTEWRRALLDGDRIVALARRFAASR